MSYKDLLVIRAQFFREDQEQGATLDYLAIRNREALRAWRVRRVTGGMHTTAQPQRSWLGSFSRSH